MKRSWPLRKQIFILMSFLIGLQSIAMLGLLFYSKVFESLDREAFRIFESTVKSKGQKADRDIESLTENILIETKHLNLTINKKVSENKIKATEIFSDENTFKDINDIAFNSILNLLINNNVTGAYVILDSKVCTKNLNLRPAIYIRNSAPEIHSENFSWFLMEVGPSYTAQKHKLGLSRNWEKYIDVSDREGMGFYYKPMEAVGQYSDTRLEDYGYWDINPSPLKDGLEITTYSLPLLDDDGIPFGVVGIEFSGSHFTKNFSRSNDIPYENGFYAITNNFGKDIDLSWHIPSGVIAQLYLKNDTRLKARNISNSGFWDIKIEGLGNMYAFAYPIHLYNEDSLFYDENWTLIGFMPKDLLHKSSQDTRRTLSISMTTITLLSILAVFMLTYISTRKIAGLSGYINELNPFQKIRFKSTGLTEIDDLIYAIEGLNKRIIDSAETTSKIMGLTNMPLGCFEVDYNNDFVTITEYIYDLLEIKYDRMITTKQWQSYFSKFISEPSNIQPGIYNYKLPGDNSQIWLRINVENTDTGQIGTIMDATDDLKTNRRLVKELEYDKLTGLYNRESFKNKVYSILCKEPEKVGAMVFIDLDNLKDVNDIYGHYVGDKYIIAAGDKFTKVKRYGAIVARISGDEFTIYLHGFDNKDDIRAIIENNIKMKDDLSIHLPDGNKRCIEYSTGVAWYPDDSENVNDLLKFADKAMYEAKRNKGSLAYYNEEKYLHISDE